MNIAPNNHFHSEVLSILELKKRRKKSMLSFGGVSLNALLLAGCGGGSSLVPQPLPQQVEAPTGFTVSGNTYTSTSGGITTLSLGDSTADLIVSSSDGADTITTGTGSDTVATGAGDDTIVAGAGDDVIRAGEGADNVQGGDGNDTILLVGTTTAGQYSSSSITNSAGGADMSSVLTASDLNNNTVSEVGAGEIIDGGAGSDSLVIYGTAYINQATLMNLDEMWVNSEVILTGEQFSMFGAFKGDGASILRVRSNDLEAITAATDDTPGGNRGHGNNTDGQDDNNPGQGHGGPNIYDKDNVDTDENRGGTSDGTTSTDGTTVAVEPTIVDISSIYMGGIGTLSLEGSIILLADDMHDFAGVTNVNGDGSTIVELAGSPNLTTTDFDLSAVNLSGIAKLDLNGNFNLIVKSANDYFGIGAIAVSGAADITLTIDSSENAGFTAAYDFTLSPPTVVDDIKVYGDTKLIFTSPDQFATTQITGITDSLTIAFAGNADGTASELLVSNLNAQLYGVDTLELGENVTLVLDDQTTLASIGNPTLAGQGTVVIDSTGMSYAELESYILGMSFDANVSVFDTNGANLRPLIPVTEVIGTTGDDRNYGTSGNDIFIGRDGNDTLTGNGGDDTYAYLTGSYFVDPVSGATTLYTDFGIDTIVDFNEGDSLDFSGSNWSFGNINIYYRGDSTEVVVGDNKVLLEGFTGVLTNIGTYNDPILAVLSEEDRLDANHRGDVRPPSVDGISIPATVNLDEGIRFYYDMDVGDDISGANYVHFRYQDTAGNYFDTYAYAQYDFEGWTTLNEWFTPGTYNLVNVWGRDNEDNDFYYNSSDIEVLGLNSSIEVTNSNPDLINPVINSITLDQSVVDLGAGDVIFATIDATDDMSGIDWIQLRFIGPDGDYFYTQFNPETGMVTELDINPYFTSGTYTVDYAWVRDNAGHKPTYSGQALIDAGLDVSFELINPNPDEIAPVLANVSSTNNLVYVVGVDDQLIIDAVATDILSEANYGYLNFTNQDDYSKNIYITYEDNIGAINIDADLWPEGSYSLTSGYIYDHADNFTSITEETLAIAQISFSFDVVAPLKINGTVEDDLLIGGDGYDLFVMGANFGSDTIESFTVGEDYVDLRATTFGFDEIVQTVTTDGLLIEAGTDSVLVKGLSEALTSEYLLTHSNSGAPTLTGITLGAADIDATDGANLEISITLEDTRNELDYGYLRFTAPDGDFIYHYIYSNSNLSISEWLSEWTVSGVYELDYVYLRGSNGNDISYNSTQLVDMGFTTSYTVTNATEDTDMPTLTGFTVSATTIEVGIENVINFQATGDDTTSGIDHFKVTVTDPSGDSKSYSLNDEHQFIGGTNFSDWSDAGTYTISVVTAYDIAGNATEYDTAALPALGFQTTFEVTDARSDVVAPVLTGLTLDQVYLDPDDIGTDPLIANLTVDETGSGYSYSYIYYQNESGSSYNAGYSNSLASSFSSYGAPGIYSISQVNIYDIAGNSTVYNTIDLAAMGLDRTFRLLGDGEQPGVAVDGTAGIDNITGTSADEVFTLYLGTDTVTFGADWGHDTIADYIQGDDVLDFSDSGLTYDDLIINDTSFGLFINDANGNDLLLQGFHGELQAGDALFATTNGTSGNDTISAGLLESIDASAGDDVITITDENFNSVDGGSGYDTLMISGDDLDGIEGMIDMAGLVARDAVLNFESLDISNPDTDDTLLLTADQVIAMTDVDNVMVIDGDVGDTLNSQGEGWIANGTTIIGGLDYNVYSSGDATIHVDPEVELILS